VAYLAGIYSSPRAASWGRQYGKFKTLAMMILMMLVGLMLMLINQLAIVFIGLLIFTFSFFAAHSTASSWVSIQSLQYRAVGSSLYLFCYYLGSSVLGSSSGLVWENYGWIGFSFFVAGFLLFGLAASFKLRTD
jgi:YNFM family putative membrane transporter